MEKYNFDVTLYTRIGKRKGKLCFSVNNGIIDGVLNLFQGSQRVQGVMDDEGVCSIQGKISTLMNEFSFIATGQVVAERIMLTLRGACRNFKLVGVQNG